MEGGSSSTPVGSEQAPGTVTTSSTTGTSSSSSEFPSNKKVGSKGTQLATAVEVVDENPIVVADPVEGSEEQEKGGKSKQKRFFAILALGLLAVVVIALSLGLTTRGTGTESSGSSVSSNESGMDQSGSQENPILEEDYQERREGAIALLETLYEDFEGGVDIFESSSPLASEDRIAALDWLVKQDMVPIPPLPGNTSEAVMQDYEQQVYKVRQRYVLALLYMATNGENWDEQYNFLSTFDECLWTSIYNPDSVGSYAEDEFNVRGAICNDKGQIEKFAMWWNGMSGTLPHELSLFSDSLKELNIAGGSISGSIPSSLTKLTNLEALVINDNCFSGDVPEQINPINHPKLGIVAIHMNNYELTANAGNLGAFCDGSGGRIEGVVALAADCPSNKFLDNQDGNLTLAETAPYDCDCCICCYPEEYKCQDLVSGGSWTSYFLHELSSNGYPKGFDTMCVSVGQQAWIAENCPCLIDVSTDIPSCTTDCTQEGAIPSYDFGG